MIDRGSKRYEGISFVRLCSLGLCFFFPSISDAQIISPYFFREANPLHQDDEDSPLNRNREDRSSLNGICTKISRLRGESQQYHSALQAYEYKLSLLIQEKLNPTIDIIFFQPYLNIDDAFNLAPFDLAHGYWD